MKQRIKLKDGGNTIHVIPKKERKYNTSTGCYKIDVFLDGSYLWSTDQHKTCKSAKARALELNPGIDPKRIKALFYYL